MKIITLNGKEYRGEIIRKGNDSRNLNIYQVRLEDGRTGMVHADNIRDEKVELTMEEQVVELCKEMQVNYSNGIQDEIVVEGFDYIVYIHIDEETKTFDMSTLNTNVDWDAKEAEDIYFDMSDAYKNQVSRKTLKAVKNYIERYVG